jgi:hypothetical protein
VCQSQRMPVPFHILQHRALGCPRSRNRGDQVHGGARAVTFVRAPGDAMGKLGLRFGRVDQHWKFQESESDATSIPVNENAASYNLLAHLK